MQEKDDGPVREMLEGRKQQDGWADGAGVHDFWKIEQPLSEAYSHKDGR
jgi:hypothetical protein